MARRDPDPDCDHDGTGVDVNDDNGDCIGWVCTECGGGHCAC